jgi:hypothetical protein
LSDDDAYEDEMGIAQLDDRGVDRLLAGQSPAVNGDLEEVAAFVRELTFTFYAAPDAATERRHLTAIMDAVPLPPVPAAASKAPARSTARLGGRSRGVRLAFVGALAVGSFCGVAYAGVLPGPVQGAVSDAARTIGVSLPGAHDNKNDGARNDSHGGGQNNNAPESTGTPTNSGPETNGTRDQNNAQQGTGQHGEQGNGNRNDQGEGSQQGSTGQGSQHGRSGSQGNASDPGTHSEGHTATNPDQASDAPGEQTPLPGAPPPDLGQGAGDPGNGDPVNGDN